MGKLIREKNWSRTSLGPPEAWPQSLKTAVQIMLGSRYPMFVWWGRDLVNIYNDAYRPIMGVRHPTMLGNSAREVWREIWPAVGPRADAVLRRGQATFDENLQLIISRHGYPEESYFTFSYSPLLEEDGTIGGLFCAVSDESHAVIARRRLDMQRLLASGCTEANSSEVVHEAVRTALSANDADLPFAILCVSDPSGQLTIAAHTGFQRDAAEAFFAQLETGKLTDMARQRDARIVVLPLEETSDVLPKGPWDCTPRQMAVVPLKRGSDAPRGVLLVGLNPYQAFDGDFRTFLTTTADQIAGALATVEAYESEHRRADALAEADRAKTIFFSNISHEFRTPLTLMLGPLEDEIEATATDPSRRERLEMIRRNGLRLLRLVNTLLEFSRAEAGWLEPSLVPFDLAEATRAAVDIFRPAIEAAGLRLDLHCTLPDVSVRADPDFWDKIVLNLLSNAFKFTLEGGIKVTLGRDGDCAVLEVADTGFGIEADQIDKIFDRFQRIEGTPARSYEGSGIGLALVKQLVTLLNGTIDVSSEPGRGTTFRVRLPIVVAAETAGTETVVAASALPRSVDGWIDARSSMDDNAATMARASAPRILIVDDNPDMRAHLVRLLSPHYAVTTARDGQEALDIVMSTPPDLVLSDVMMPRLDGEGLVRAIRADPKTRQIAIILLSARAGSEASVEGLSAGADDYVVKPFATRELLARIDVNLRLAQMRRESRAGEAHLAAVVASTRDAVVTFSTDGRIKTWNRGAERLFGYRESEAVRHGLSLLIDPQFQGLMDAQFLTALSGVALQLDTTLLARDGTEIEVSIGLAPIGGQETPISGVAAIIRDIRRRRRAEATDLMLAAIARHSSDAVFSIDDNRNISAWNPAAERLYGYTSQEAIGAPMEIIIPTDRMPEMETMTEAVMIRGETVQIETLRRRKNGSLVDVAISASPLREPGGRIVGISVIHRDITQQRRQEEQTRFIMRELAHRSKNLLAIILSMASQTARSAKSISDFTARFTQRLQGLSHSHDLLLQRDWRGVSMQELAERQLQHFVDGESTRVGYVGPPVMVDPKAAQNIGLALHELATNASKYGALSSPGGRVNVSWSLHEGRFRLEWREVGGPQVVAPDTRGFGQVVLERLASDALEGRVQLNYAPEGVVWTLEIPSSYLVDSDSHIGGEALREPPHPV
jgi:PAS domain S-box-containing protein